MTLVCAVCGPEEERTAYGTRSGYELVRCRRCGLVFLDRLEETPNARFYADAAGPRRTKDQIEYWSVPEQWTRHRAVFERFFEERWRRIESLHPRIQRLLDVGCGYGFFLHWLRGRVPELRGLEIDPTAAAWARTQLGLAVAETRIEDFRPAALFDAIVMCDVLEHLAEPRDVLEHCRELLAPGGVLFVQVPNLLGFRLPLGHGWGLPHHIWQFGPQSLGELTTAAGFRVQRWYTGVMGVIGAYERGGPSLASRATWWAARTFRLGNRLMLVAERPS